MTKAPKISIVTINYNNAQGLEQTIDSVLCQTYQDINYLVIDGASTDRSVSVIEKNANRLDYWVSEKDLGIYNAMNKGIRAAQGEYILFLNSGDRLMDKHIIQKVVEAGLDTDLVYGDLLFFSGEKEWLWTQPDTLTFQTFYQSTLPHPSTFIKKGLFDLVGFYDEKFKIVSDWKFFTLAIVKHNCSYKHIHCTVSAYGFDGMSSQPKNLDLIKAERMSVLKDYFPMFISDYENLEKLQQEVKQIGYFLKTRKIIKKMLGQK